MPPRDQFVAPSKPKLPPAPKKSAGAGAVAGIRSVAPPPPPSPAQVVGRAAATGLSHVAHTTHAASRAAGRATSTVGRSQAAAGTATAQKAAGNTYRQAVIAVFNHQSQPQQQAILKGALKNPQQFESRLILNYVKSNHQAAISSGYVHGVGGSLGSALGQGTASLAHLTDQELAAVKPILTGGSPRYGTQTAGFGPGPIANVAVGAPIDIARATIEDPSVLPKTVQGLGSAALGSAAALAQLPFQIATEGPVKAIGDLASGVGKNYAYRYGPLAAGNDKAFIARIKKQGAGQELLDALGVAGGLDATVGRAVAKLGKTRETMSGHPNVLTRERPDLRVSGGESRTQHLAPTAGRVLAQRVEDHLRRAHGGKEVLLGKHEVAPLLQGRAMRVLVSGVSSKTRHVMQGHLDREVRHGAEPAVRQLSTWEQRAMPFAIGGWIPLRSGERAAFDAIERRKQQIAKDRESPRSPGSRIPPQIKNQVDELHNLTELQANIGKWLTPRLADFVQKEAERSTRLERTLPNSYLTAPTAEARRLREQGTVLGHEHPYEARDRQLADLQKQKEALQRTIKAPKSLREHQDATASLERLQARIDKLRTGHDMPAQMRAYSTKVRMAARKEGMPEPAYLQHMVHPKEKFSSYATGQGERANAGAKESGFHLFRGGAVYRHPQAYVDSLATSIKAAHQWHFADEQFRRNALPTPSRADIRAALGKDKAPADLTGFELKQALLHAGVDLKHTVFYNPGRLSERTLAEHDLLPPKLAKKAAAADKGALASSRAGSTPPSPFASTRLHHALGQDDAVVDGLDAKAGDVSEAFMTTPGWKALPRSAYDEIHSASAPSGPAGRLVGKFQGATAMAILGLSPSFVIMNTIAHVFLATFGTRGRILSDMAKFPLWWHGLSDAERDIVRSHAGGRGNFRLERLGSTAQDGPLAALRDSWNTLKQQKILHFVSAANPIRILFKAEDTQSNFFRHMVYYHAAKRLALDRMTREMGPAAMAMERLSHVFDVGPKRQMAEIIAHQADAEQLGRHVVNMMGDYSRFTSRERKWLNNRAVLFYSFLRHATRTLLYVLPVHHPIATALVGELALLHNDEVKKMLGGADLPWTYSRLFFQGNGHLSSIDFARASPVGGLVADAASEGIRGLASLIAPELQPVLDEMYGNTATGQPVPQNVWTFLNDYASLSYPYRLAKDLHFGTKLQQPDSVPFVHERPEVRKSTAGKQYLAAKQNALGPIDQKMLAGFLGLYPKPDDSVAIAKHRIAALPKKKTAPSSSSPYLMDGTHGGASSGGYLLGGSHSSSSSGYLLK